MRLKNSMKVYFSYSVEGAAAIEAAEQSSIPTSEATALNPILPATAPKPLTPTKLSKPASTLENDQSPTPTAELTGTILASLAAELTEEQLQVGKDVAAKAASKSKSKVAQVKKKRAKDIGVTRSHTLVTYRKAIEASRKRATAVLAWLWLSTMR